MRRLNNLLILTSLIVLQTACSTSTQTKRTADITKNVVTGTFGEDDYKSQFTIRGIVERNQNCVVLLKELNVQVEGPLPSTAVVAVANPNELGTFQIISKAKPGKYSVKVFKNVNSKAVLDSKEIQMSKTQDRFNVLFDVCRSNRN